MFDEFFYRRRKSKGILVFMVLLMLLGVGLFVGGLFYLF
jgi:hypothetical protein